RSGGVDRSPCHDRLRRHARWPFDGRRGRNGHPGRGTPPAGGRDACPPGRMGLPLWSGRLARDRASRLVRLSDLSRRGAPGV
ncbi:uncharacterized protein METZ01_LOCUS465890, partial [marine metagenome]